jgi:hypothetical protein
LPQQQPRITLLPGASFITEEKARQHAKALAQSLSITFYVVRSREGRYLSVQWPSDDCEILTTVAPPDSVYDTPQRRPTKVPD